MKFFTDMNLKDENGPINIPSESSFYFVLMKDKLYILYSRRNLLSQTMTSLDTNSIEPIEIDEYNIYFS